MSDHEHKNQMLGLQFQQFQQKRPSEILSRLISDEAGVNFPAPLLRLFVRAHAPEIKKLIAEIGEGVRDG